MKVNSYWCSSSWPGSSDATPKLTRVTLPASIVPPNPRDAWSTSHSFSASPESPEASIVRWSSVMFTGLPGRWISTSCPDAAGAQSRIAPIKV